MAEADGAPTPPGVLMKRGCVTVGVSLALLFGSSVALGLQFYAGLALGIQLAVYLFHGLPFKSERFYDLSGSATHFAVVSAALMRHGSARSARQTLASLAAVLWMTRLGSFLFLRIERDGRDERFDRIKLHWLAFFGAWCIQALWVVLVEAPILLLNEAEDSMPLSLFDVVCLGAWLAGFGLEAVSDAEKFVFRCDEKNRGKFITTGLWAFSRHPNYFGEMTMWAALAALCAQSTQRYGALVSPLFTAFLLLKGSGVPLVERAGLKKWGGDPKYLHYMAQTSCIIPMRPAPMQPKSS
ncbi:hypothetical protein M885DRAFT_509635 [Pelagophyceae sp. CCMP2097]|nr:hypothetical protein M885DRAFT_509635 [Pelagophyceae sp. CCMP2097]